MLCFFELHFIAQSQNNNQEGSLGEKVIALL